jgi:hypothetical protein
MFVLRGCARCGTEMLRSALDGHDKIICHDQLFSQKYSKKISESSPEGYLQSYRLRQTDGFVACGTAVEGDDAVQKAIRKMWQAVEMCRTPVVAIQRKDLLRRVASEVIAKTTGVYHVPLKDKPRRTSHTVVLTVEQVVRSADVADKVFATTSVYYPWAHVVHYEDLLTDWEDQMAGIFQYLGVPNAFVGAMTRRQEIRRIRDIIYNYEDLKTRLYDTRPELFDTAEQTDDLFSR